MTTVPDLLDQANALRAELSNRGLNLAQDEALAIVLRLREMPSTSAAQPASANSECLEPLGDLYEALVSVNVPLRARVSVYAKTSEEADIALLQTAKAQYPIGFMAGPFIPKDCLEFILEPKSLPPGVTWSSSADSSVGTAAIWGDDDFAYEISVIAQPPKGERLEEGCPVTVTLRLSNKRDERLEKTLGSFTTGSNLTDWLSAALKENDFLEYFDQMKEELAG